MAEKKFSKWQVLWIVPPIVVGYLFVQFMIGAKPQPEMVDNAEQSRVVKISIFKKSDFTPAALGYGIVEPAQQWHAVAQVSGKIISMHPLLRDGEMLAAGTELFRIDPVDYELSLLNAQADFSELDIQESNYQASLKIEYAKLDLAIADLKRQETLKSQGLLAQNKADDASRNVLTYRVSVQNLENSLALIPTQRKRLQYKVQQATRDLANSIVAAPFNLRVSGLGIEEDQYVSKGQELFQGDSVDRVEVNAQVSYSAIKNLFIGRPNLPESFTRINDQVQNIAGFRPEIRLDMGDGVTAKWQAEFVRISDQVDVKTRSLGVIVAVDNPMLKTIPGRRPPLGKGMFVQVNIKGRDQLNQIVIPRSIIRNGQLFLMDSDNRLKIQPANVLFRQGDFAVLADGLNDGDRLVLTDLVPAIEGMLLQAANAPKMAE